MQAISGSFLIVLFFFMSICSLTQQRTDIKQTFLIVDEITFDNYALNSISERNNNTDFAPDNISNPNNRLKVKAIRPFLMIMEFHANDLLFNPNVL